MYDATLVRHDPRGFLTRLGQRFGSARELRARLLAAALGRALEERFDTDWFRNPRSGQFLGQWLAGGLSRYQCRKEKIHTWFHRQKEPCLTGLYSMRTQLP